ncbi:polymorphic toxin-type HINT domain-containing protein [Actinoplanes missouriensis]|uniref:polymorphic toxin-type HINT domain-containing protein n=1 Tax=Actinoplanes missouriensis TaxID=1866 RepID=UPI00155DC051|nr:polymorphic toxin-type HINT domain-containing protein [Actinoplanes missouriensis]
MNNGHPGIAKRKKKLKDDDRGCRGANGFLLGTPVLPADGTTVAIERVKVGDWVLSTEPITGITTGKPVTAVIVGDGYKKLVEVTIDVDGDHGDRTAIVTATDNHPFWVPALASWIDAGHLAPRIRAGSH